MPSENKEKIHPPCNILVQKIGKDYYIVFPYEKQVQQKSGLFDEHMVGLDPGCRKFVSFYGTDGRIGFLGSKNPGRKFARMQWYKDFLQEQLYAPKASCIRVTGKKRKKTKTKLRKLQERMDNIRKDFHHKTANWLTNNYQCIVIGKLPKGIISRDRSLPKTVKRAYNSLAHFKFRCCLKEKCQTKGVIFQEINESYTSKTCTHCGKLNNIGSSETYKCCCSEKTWDRDLNGARNILLKAISGSYARIVLQKNETLSLQKPIWTQHPLGFSLGLEIINDD